MADTVLPLDPVLRLISALSKAGLRNGGAGVRGTEYAFLCEYGSHHHCHFGVMEVPSISDEGGLMIQVSARYYLTDEIIGLKWQEGDWHLCVRTRQGEHKFYTGTLRLIS